MPIIKRNDVDYAGGGSGETPKLYTTGQYLSDQLNGEAVVTKSQTPMPTPGYSKEWRIPTIGTGITGSTSLGNMLTNTAGNVTGTPSINTIYYIKD